ncbi:hypothetical protein, partial [Staphylococcus hominis]|uniref:hypothetical protein n=1 Tax=Staphylococcus hominis TaxID=1290 RepID=UPI0016437F4F
MEERIKGVVLFDETSKALNVKDEIVAFNEDGFECDDGKEGNMIDEMVDYDGWMIEKSGGGIM